MIFVANGISKMSRNDFFTSERGIGVIITEKVYQIPCLDNFLPKILFPQNFPSLLVGHILNPNKTDRVLDMCSAPGGKATHAAILMGKEGKVVALERSGRRASQMNRLVEANGLTGRVEVIHTDAAKSLIIPSNVRYQNFQILLIEIDSRLRKKNLKNKKTMGSEISRRNRKR
jgi:16S rRNA C967 or C1407 C5-methylase (RsmB/RsmF family)